MCRDPGQRCRVVLIAGAGGHALEVLEVFHARSSLAGLHFYDDVNEDLPDRFLGQFALVRTLEEAERLFKGDPRFVLGVGGVEARRILARRLEAVGGSHCSVVAPSAKVGNYQTHMAVGADVMENVWISNMVTIGVGVLLNRGCAVHHHCEIGTFTEVGPGAQLLGRTRVGEACLIGAGAVVLPGIEIGAGAMIGAGAVVTRSVPPGGVWTGVPAAPHRESIGDS